MNYRKLLPHQNLKDIYFPVPERTTNGATIIGNETLIAPIHNYLKAFYPNNVIEEVVESRNNLQFFVKLRLVEQLHTVLAKDKVYPQIIIQNSYDGSVKPKVGVGYMRLICTNGLMNFDVMTELKIENNQAFMTDQLAPVFEELETLEIKEAKAMPHFRRLARRRINQNEINWVFNEFRRHPNRHFSDNLLRRALLVARSEAKELGVELSAWLLYNGFNNAFNHIPFAFENMDLLALDKKVLNTIEKVLQPNYRPIILPAPKQSKAKNSTTLDSWSGFGGFGGSNKGSSSRGNLR